MDWIALRLSLVLALTTSVILLPIGVSLARVLAYREFRGKSALEATLALPLVLPPTVLGFYLLVAMGGASPIGSLYENISGHPLAFSFAGLVVAAVIFNVPFFLIPMQRSFEAIPLEVRQAAACCGLSRWRTLWRIELPLAWPGLLAGTIMTVAHTIGEFGVVLMVGGSIPGETKTIAISIYDEVQAFDMNAAALMSAILLILSLAALAITNWLSRRSARV